MKATNSFSTTLVPNRPPAVAASFHGMFSMYMTGWKIVPRMQLEAELGMAEPGADPAEQAVGERDQGDEGEHHRADRDRELDAGLRALGGGHDDVGRPLLAMLGLVDRRRLEVARGGVVGHDDLGHQDAARRGHEARGEQIGQQMPTPIMLA